MKVKATLIAITLAMTGLSVQAQIESIGEVPVGVPVLEPTDRLPMPKNKTTYWIVYDDNAAEDGIGSSAADTIEVLMKFDIQNPPVRLERVRLGLARLGDDRNMDLWIVIRNATSSGLPGSIIRDFGAHALDVPFGFPGAWYEFDLSSYDLTLNSSSVFIGVGWIPQPVLDFFQLVDLGSGTSQPGFVSFNAGAWSDLRSNWSNYKACMIRALVSTVETGSCTYTLNPTGRYEPAEGGTGSFDVRTNIDCGWSASTSAAWIDISGGASGAGDGTVYYSVRSNPSTEERQGTIRVADKFFNITQRGVDYGCTEDFRTVCLNNGRFRLRVNWKDFQGEVGNGKVASYRTADSALFWFFRESNLEMLVKVINGCSLTHHYWVLGAATTNVQYRLYVTDMKTGEERSYGNPLGTYSPAIIDTEAFATCP